MTQFSSSSGPTDKSDGRLRYSYKTKPFSHQKKALTKLLKLEGRGALLMEMGTGKTKVAIDWAGLGFYNWDVRKVLVVAPLSVLSVWPRQIKQHSSAPYRVFRLHGSTRDRVRMLQLLVHPAGADDSRITWAVINYEGLWRESAEGSVEKLLQEWAPDVIIYDESHRLKSHSSRQSRAAERISQVARHRLLLTGTPLTKAPLDFYGQFRAMDQKAFGGMSWFTFKFTYGVWAGLGKYKLVKYKRLPLLTKIVRRWSYRIKKSQCLDLPPKVYVDVPVTLSEREKKVYDEMAKEMIAELEEAPATAAIAAVKLIRLSQITSGFVKDVEKRIITLGDSKLRACMDLVHDMLEEGHKIVIFCRFTHDIEKLAEALSSDKTKFRILSGSVPPKRRDSIIEEFQTDPEVKVFIAQIQAGSLGIELTAADVAIYFSMNYNAGDYWQSQDRLHRHGQNSDKVTYYRLVVPKTIDQIVFEVLEHKGKVAEYVLHDPTVLRRT